MNGFKPLHVASNQETPSPLFFNKYDVNGECKAPAQGHIHQNGRPINHGWFYVKKLEWAGQTTMWSFGKSAGFAKPSTRWFLITAFAAANSPLRWSLWSWKFFAKCHLEGVEGPRKGDLTFVTPSAPMAQKPRTNHIEWQSLPGNQHDMATHAPFLVGLFKVQFPAPGMFLSHSMQNPRASKTICSGDGRLASPSCCSSLGLGHPLGLRGRWVLGIRQKEEITETHKSYACTYDFAEDCN